MPMDGSEPAKKALKYLLEISSQAAWPLTVVTITGTLKRLMCFATEAEELAGGYSADCEIITLQGKESEEDSQVYPGGRGRINGYGGLRHNRLLNYSWAHHRLHIRKRNL